VKGEKVAPLSVRLDALLCGQRVRRSRPPGTARPTRASGATGGWRAAARPVQARVSWVTW